MNIAIIGAGFTGLSAAYNLQKQGHNVTIFEKDNQPGGLAIGYQEKGWEWTLEKHYHHWFTNDDSVLNLAKEIGHDVIIKRPKSSVFINGHIFQFDSPKEVLFFSQLPLIDRLRMAAIVGLLRYNPVWHPLEKVNASTFLPKAMGQKAYKMIWEPQFKNKFGEFANDVSLAWFWARIKKRTSSLAYPKGGFLAFATHMTEVITQQNGKVFLQSETIELKQNIDKTITISAKDKQGKIKKEIFDKVIVTLPSFLFLQITPQLPTEYKNKLVRLKGLGATNLVLRLKKPFLPDNTYWLSVTDINSPIMAIVEHTNFMNKKYYNDEHIVYLGNYMPSDSRDFLMTEEEKLKLFDPFLRSINPDYKKDLMGYKLFKAPFAQPIIPTNYSKMIPATKTPLQNIYLANIEQVYPWDRGTNYAVELGEKVARLINENEELS